MENGVQRWRCKDCRRYFLGREKPSETDILGLYRNGKLGTKDIARLLGISRSTVCRALRNFRNETRARLPPKPVVAMMDATYRGWNFGVVAIKDHFSGTVLWHKFIDRKERVGDYVEGVQALEQQGFRIIGVVSDGLKGLRDRLSAYPFQYCQFHQMLTVRHKLTAHPKLSASRELLDLAGLLCHTDKESFMGLLNEWHAKWEGFLNERTADERGRTFYTHKNLRSAYNSLKRNTPWLWTFYDRPELGLPNTNNEMEALFSSVKDKLRLHRGLSVERRKVLIEELFFAHSPRR